MYEEAAERLLEALTGAFGATPHWELVPNRSYGFYLHYDEDGVALADVRDVMGATLNYGVGVILGLYNERHLSPPTA
jgi:hypothetical protein